MSIQTLPVSYTSVTRINSAFPMISSVSNITSAVVAQYAGDVEARINAMISKRYHLPLAVECPLLIAVATRESIYAIALGRALVQFPPAQQGQHPLQVQHKDDKDVLEKLMKGDIQLVDSSGGVLAADTTQLQIFSTTMNYFPTFHEGEMEDQIQDPSKIDDLLSARDL